MALLTDYWSLDGIIILASLMIAAYLYMTRKFNYWRKRGVLEVPPTPFLGNFGNCLFLKQSPQHMLKAFYDQAKGQPYIGFYLLDKPALLICDHKLVQNIFIKDFNNFYDRHNSADPRDRVGYSSLFSIKNPAWRIVRAKLTPFFTSGKMKNMFGLILQCGKNLDEYLNTLKLEGNGKVINVKGLSTKFTSNVIATTAFGLDVDPFKDPDNEFCKNGNLIFHLSLIRGLEMLALFFFPNIVRMFHIKAFGTQPTAFMRKIFWETITMRMQSGQKRNDLIDILIELKKKHGDEDISDFKFDEDDLMAQPASFFSAFDTTATPLAFTLYELATNPEIQTKLRNEILETLENSNGDITYQMVMSDLPYLEMVLSEILRLYPSLAFLNRRTMNDYKIPDTDLVIEKDTPVYIPMLGFHYDPQYFPDPYKFDPERFSEKNKRNIPSCVYFPFGEGPHACIGTRFAFIQMKLMLLIILSKYEVTPCTKVKQALIDPKGTMTTPLGGVVNLNIRKIIKM